MNDTATNKEIGELIKNLFKGYDRYCFTMGNYTQDTKETARYYTNEIDSLNYDRDVVEQAIRLARDDYPNKPPPLTEILVYCKKLARKKNQPKPEPEDKTPMVTQETWRRDWEKEAEKGNPYAKMMLERFLINDQKAEIEQETKEDLAR